MKRIAIAAIGLVTAFMMFGCSSGNQSPQETQQQEERPEAASTVYGKVTSIVGNEVVISLGTPKVSTASSLSETGGQGQSGGNWGGENRPSGTPGQMPSGGSAGSGARRSGQGTSSGGASRNGYGTGAASGSRGTAGSGFSAADGSGAAGGTGVMQSSPAVELTYSGDTATYLLPAGMKIGTGDFTSVAKGNVLQITLNAEGTITSVTILSTK